MTETAEAQGTQRQATRFGREVSPFAITLEGALVFEVRVDEATVTIILEVKDAYGSPFVAVVPLNYFATPERLNTFLGEVKRNFFEVMRQNLSQELAADLGTISDSIASVLGLNTNRREEIINNHLAKTKERLAHLLSPLPDKPRRAVWTNTKLEQAVRVAGMEVCGENRKLTLEAVSDALRETHGDDAPASGEALRKQLERFKIDWMKLKADIKRLANVRLND